MSDDALINRLMQKLNYLNEETVTLRNKNDDLQKKMRSESKLLNQEIRKQREEISKLRNENDSLRQEIVNLINDNQSMRNTLLNSSSNSRLPTYTIKRSHRLTRSISDHFENLEGITNISGIKFQSNLDASGYERLKSIEKVNKPCRSNSMKFPSDLQLISTSSCITNEASDLFTQYQKHKSSFTMSSTTKSGCGTTKNLKNSKLSYIQTPIKKKSNGYGCNPLLNSDKRTFVYKKVNLKQQNLNQISKNLSDKTNINLNATPQKSIARRSIESRNQNNENNTKACSNKLEINFESTITEYENLLIQEDFLNKLYSKVENLKTSFSQRLKIMKNSEFY